MDARNLLRQLLIRAGARQTEFADVVADVEVAVVDPHGLVDPQRHRLQPLPEHRHSIETRGEDRRQSLEREGLGRRRGIEDAEAPDMARRGRRLEREEGGVEPGQSPRHELIP